jgi:hypothetical protein
MFISEAYTDEDLEREVKIHCNDYNRIQYILTELGKYGKNETLLYQRVANISEYLARKNFPDLFN